MSKSQFEVPTLEESLLKEYGRQLDIIMRNREHYLAAFIAETGFKPSECEIVERRESNGDLVLFARKREGV